MGSTTPVYALPYPSGSDRVRDGDNSIQALAERTEAVLGTITPLTVPTGAVMPFAGAVAPTGWMFCDGTAISRTTYAALFAVISTTYGAGNGSTTFAIPDLRSRFPVGAGQGTGLRDRPRGTTGGGEDQTLPSHAHGASSDVDSPDHAHASTISDGAGSHIHQVYLADVQKSGSGTIAQGYSGTPGNGTTGAGGHNHAVNNPGATARHAHGVTVSANGVSPADGNVPPFLSLQYIIKT